MARSLTLTMALLAGCAPSVEDGLAGHTDGSTAMADKPIVSLDVSPAMAALTTTGTAVTQPFVATAHYADGTTGDVTGSCAWSVSDPAMGAVDGTGHYVSPADHGGQADVVAATGGATGKAKLTLKWVATRVSQDDGSTAPADSSQKFGGATTAPLAPSVLYPLDGALVPQNLGELEVQWQRAAGTDLFEVALTAPYLDLRIYTNAALGRASLLAKEWASVAASALGDTVTITVRAVAGAAPGGVGASNTVKLGIGRDAVQGGIYYWASTAAGGSVEGIQRHAFGDTTGNATPFYTETDGNARYGGSNHCVACHALSRDGKKFAITYDGGGGPAAILDVATKVAMTPQTGLFWNFATFNPDGTKLLTAQAGQLKILDAAAAPGTLLSTVNIAPATYATHPDWSADGKQIAYVTPSAPLEDWHFDGGSIVVSTDAGGGVFGGPRVLVAAQGGENNYYPSFSPDGKWVLFNRSKGDAYDDPDAETYVASTDGAIAPIKLAAADGTGDHTNSWPRWSPFVQHGGPHGDLFYFTFSSKRDYGVEIAGKNQPQIWMAAFDPSTAQAGGDPSSAPFWLPFQDPATNNHIAQWTETIVAVQ